MLKVAWNDQVLEWSVSERTEVEAKDDDEIGKHRVCSYTCLLYTSPSPRDKRQSRMPSSA